MKSFENFAFKTFFLATIIWGKFHLFILRLDDKQISYTVKDFLNTLIIKTKIKIIPKTPNAHDIEDYISTNKVA